MSKLYVNEIHPKTSGNQVLFPDRPAFRVARVASQTINNTDTRNDIEFDRTDDQNCFLQGGITISSGIITIPVAGVYSFSAITRADNITSGYFYSEIMKNANQSGAHKAHGISDAAVQYQTVTLSTVFKCEVGDEIKVVALAESDNTWSVSSTCEFSGFLIG